MITLLVIILGGAMDMGTRIGVDVLFGALSGIVGAVGVYTITSVGIVDWRDVFVIIAGNGSQSAQLEVSSVADAGDGTCLITINNYNHSTGPVDEITHAALMIKVAA